MFPNALEPEKLIELSELATDDFKSLFRYYAIDGLKFNDPQLKNELCDIGDQIAEKMSKSPLAAKVVGTQLRKEPTKWFWQATQNYDNLSSIREVLLWSYKHFNVQLQLCFLFCALYPKGSYCIPGYIEMYWIALDFIHSLDNNKNVEDIGIKYVNMMVANSIFQLVEGKYFMHDLFRDLGEKLSIKDCFRITNFEKEIPSTTLYAYLQMNVENLKDTIICNATNLRALTLNVPFNSNKDVKEVFTMVSSNFRNLRLLDVWSQGYKKLPSVVGDLRNLRFLSVFQSSIEELPDSVSRLYHLQFLILPASIKTLPKKLSNLVKLRIFGIYNENFDLLNTLPPVPYLGKLTSLQSLSEFHVRKKEGYELCQLGTLNEIAGSLRIVNLENVRQKDEAIEASLFKKPKLKSLELVWGQSSENNFDSDVLEALQPAEGLENLSIDGYRGSSYPSWLLEGSFLKNIKYIKFYNCSALAYLPLNFHQLCPCLIELRVSTCLCLIFVCENELQLNDNNGTMVDYSWLYYGMYDEFELKNVFHHEVQSFKKTDPEQNCGEKLKIIECAAEEGVPEFPTDVWSAWWQCHQQRMNFMRCNTEANKLILPSKLHVLFIGFCCISDGALSDCLRGMATLKELYLEGIMTITILPSVDVLKDLYSLRDLTIKNCWCLRSLGGLHALPNLEKFILDTCWKLKMKSNHTELPSTLQSITIDACEVSQALFFDNLQFLWRIEIKNCNSLTDLTFGHLTSLKLLNLLNCSRLRHIQSLVPPSFIDTLYLVLLPNIDVKSILRTWQGCRELHISSSTILKELLLPENFDAIQTLTIEWCNEEAISFKKSNHLQSIKTLGFYDCELKNLPSTLSDFSNLESTYFYRCSRILSLPELPKSVQLILIEDCEELKKRCQLNGPEWHKIQRIHDRFIR